MLTPFEAIDGGAVLVRDGRIERVGPREAIRAADREIDVGGRLICPGFIDLQVNGGRGVLLIDEDADAAVASTASDGIRFGATSLLPTVVSASEETMARGLAAVARRAGDISSGARVLGAHLEGPFLSQRRRGAHPERFVVPPDRGLFERLLAAAGGSLRLITLAPEPPGALDLIAAARAAGVVVSIGHSDATYEEALRGIEAGAAVGTHLFNGMRPLAHRDPGVIGALLQSDHVTVTMIPDGVHVHPAVLEIAARAKGVDRAALVTDALSPAGESRSMRLGAVELTLRDGAWYLPDGTLAGSAIGMSDAVRLMSGLPGVSLLDAVRMATATPARVLGLEGEIGVLASGARADIVVCERDFTVRQVFVDGALAYEA